MCSTCISTAPAASALSGCEQSANNVSETAVDCAHLFMKLTAAMSKSASQRGKTLTLSRITEGLKLAG
jgi:hypothetical protein